MKNESSKFLTCIRWNRGVCHSPSRAITHIRSNGKVYRMPLSEWLMRQVLAGNCTIFDPPY